MAKSLRSKAVRKNKDAKRATVFKPAADARLQRLAARDALAMAAAEMDTMATDLTTAVEKVEQEVTKKVSMFDTTSEVPKVSGKRGKWRRNREKVFSPYGISVKEMRF
jgi:hypothetical protein